MSLDLDNTRRPRPHGPRWGPAARLASASAGLACLGAARHAKGYAKVGFGIAGAGLLLRSSTSVPTDRLLSSMRDPYAFEARRSVVIARPVAEVFSLLSDYANYPAFMPNVRDMTVLPGLRHRWSMVGPGGLEIPVRDAILQLVPDTFVSWESEPDSTLPYAGAALFASEGPSTTRVDARMSYGPPLGAFGHAAATLIGQGPGAQLDAILEHARGYLEAGRHAGP